MKFQCLSINQGTETNRFWLCKVKVKDLLTKCRVDYNSPENPKGCQREVSKHRARKFGLYMLKGNMSPINFLINIRENEIVEGDGFLYIPDHLDWWLVDGQHRFEGLKILIDQEKEESLKELQLPVAIINVDRINEAKQFLIINKSQKGVRTDLAERIFFLLKKREGKEKILEKDYPFEFWKSEALVVVDMLTDTKNSPLCGLIKRPGEKGYKPLRQVSVTDSLYDVIANYKVHLKNETYLAKALMNMWAALKEVCPECFAKPKDYLLLKTMGVYVMHKLFAKLIPILASSKDLTKSIFVKIFTHSQVKGYFSSNYWNRENLKGISKYETSSKSVNIVCDLIWSSITNIMEEIAPKAYEVKM